MGSLDYLPLNTLVIVFLLAKYAWEPDKLMEIFVKIKHGLLELADPGGRKKNIKE